MGSNIRPESWSRANSAGAKRLLCSSVHAAFSRIANPAASIRLCSSAANVDCTTWECFRENQSNTTHCHGFVGSSWSADASMTIAPLIASPSYFKALNAESEMQINRNGSLNLLKILRVSDSDEYIGKISALCRQGWIFHPIWLGHPNDLQKVPMWQVIICGLLLIIGV